MHSHTHTDKPVRLTLANALLPLNLLLFFLNFIFYQRHIGSEIFIYFSSSKDFRSNVFTLKGKLLTVHIYQKLACLLTHQTQT